MTAAALRNYLFVCGVPRSGTTALCEILNLHPAVALGVERYKYVAMRETAELFRPDLFERARFFDIRPDDTNIRAEKTYARLMRKYDVATYVGDKVPRYYVRLPLIFERFAGAVVIYIVRRIEDVATSWNTRAGNPNDAWPAENDFRRAVEEWNRANRIALEASRERGGRFLVVAYEDAFGERGEVFVRMLLAQLGLSFADKGFAAAYRAFAATPRRRPEKIRYGEEDAHIAANADMATYAALSARRLA